MGKGFFEIEEVPEERKGGRLSCLQCGLYKTCHSPKLEPSGEGGKRIMIIGESPGEFVDRKRNETGSYLQMVKKHLSELGVSLEKDCWMTYAVNCRTEDKEGPSDRQIACCRSRVVDSIRIRKPHVVILLGMGAVNSVITDRFTRSKGTMTQWRGWQIPDRDIQAWVCPTFDPSFVIQSNHFRNGAPYERYFHHDLKKAIEHLDKVKPVVPLEVITDSREAGRELRRVMTDRPRCISFDYETTGIKPHRAGHRIVSFSIADEHCSFSLMMGEDVISPLRKILLDPRIRKTACNISFEDTWTNVKLERPVRGWIWDSMLASHYLDNRAEGITSLKFQVYVRLGIPDYEGEVSAYLKSSDEMKKLMGGNAMNRIGEIPVPKLLKYNALDSLFERRIAHMQMKELGYEY